MDSCFFSGMCLRVHSGMFLAKEGQSYLGTVSLNGQEERCTELYSFLIFCRFYFFFFPRDVPKVLLVIIQRISVIRTA